ncbi:MAG: preprotein translocase subunit YajC [Acutalibacteraceae bacterium]
MFLQYLSESAAGQQGSGMTMIIMLVAMFALMYFLMIRPQKKRQKEEQQMRDNIQIGDEVVTIGGICGRIVSIKEDAFVIETGADRCKIKMLKGAIQTNVTANEKLEAERAAAREAAEKARAEKKAAKSKKSEDNE